MKRRFFQALVIGLSLFGAIVTVAYLIEKGTAEQ